MSNLTGVTGLQCDHGTIKPAQKLTRAALLAGVKARVAAGHPVHTVYECCRFGYTLREELTAAGEQSIVTTPVKLSPERRRKNDRLDARDDSAEAAAPSGAESL
jgi:rRNA maturation protein Nop10